MVSVIRERILPAAVEAAPLHLGHGPASRTFIALMLGAERESNHLEKVLFAGTRCFFSCRDLRGGSLQLGCSWKQRNVTPLTGARPNPMVGKAG